MTPTYQKQPRRAVFVQSSSASHFPYILRLNSYPLKCYLANSFKITGSTWLLLDKPITSALLPRKEVIHPHLPVRIPCYDLTPITKFTLGRNKFGRRVLLTFMVWRAVCTRPGNVFTAACWSAITSDSDFMQASFSLQSELGLALVGFAPPRGFAAHCTSHCRTFLAQDVRPILTWHHPLLPPRYRGSLVRKIQLTTRVALVDGLNQTSHDTSWRRPCRICHLVLKKHSLLSEKF